MNSPQAAGRIVALALLADGHLCKRELDVLDQRDAHGQLGLTQGELHNVVHGFCEDLLATAHGHWGAACQLDAGTLCQLLSDIDDPVLCRQVLGLCTAVTDADQHLAEGESLVLLAAVEHWVDPGGAASACPGADTLSPQRPDPPDGHCIAATPRPDRSRRNLLALADPKLGRPAHPAGSAGQTFDTARSSMG